MQILFERNAPPHNQTCANGRKQSGADIKGAATQVATMNDGKFGEVRQWGLDAKETSNNGGIVARADTSGNSCRGEKKVFERKVPEPVGDMPETSDVSTTSSPRAKTVMKKPEGKRMKHVQDRLKHTSRKGSRTFAARECPSDVSSGMVSDGQVKGEQVRARKNGVTLDLGETEFPPLPSKGQEWRRMEIVGMC